MKKQTKSPSPPHLIALTGGIGCGKSATSQIFEDLGAAIVEADDLARQAVIPGSSGLTQIVEHFGSRILLPDGTLDRSQMAEVIFNNQAKRRELEKIVHPIVRSLLLEHLVTIKTTSPEVRLIIYSVPLLFETGSSEDDFDGIISVSCSKEIAMERIIKRDKIDRSFALKKISSQLPVEEKNKRADFVIVNETTLEDLRAQIEILIPKLLELPIRSRIMRSIGQHGY